MERLMPQVNVRAARGGYGPTLTELKKYQKALRVLGRLTPPDLLVVASDANCMGVPKRRAEVEECVDKSLFPRYVIACPDPHVERWYMADPQSFCTVVGAGIDLGTAKCEPGFYKQRLQDAIRQGGHPATLRGKEFAPDLVQKMDLYRAGRNEPSLGDFVAGLRGQLLQIVRERRS